jgi:hypothetical protein
MPTKLDLNAVAQSFQMSLAGELAKAGLDLRMPVAGVPDQELVIGGQIVRADPGSRLMRYFFTWFAGGAVFEVEGQVVAASVPLGQFHAKGTRRAGVGGGDSQKMLVDAARLAGQESARQILATMAAR